MKRRGIIGAGNWIVDRVKTIDRWPNEGELAHIGGIESAGGGGPCNVLFDLAALQAPDLPLYAAGVVGNDADGEFLLAEIRRRQIDERYMRVSESAPTSFTDVMSGNGKRTFFHYAGANDEFGREDLAQADVPARIFYFGYLLLLEKLDAADPLHGTAAAGLLKDMGEKGYLTAVDMVSAAPERFFKIVPPALPYTDILVINEVEAGNLLGKALRTADGALIPELLPEAARHLLELGVRSLAAIHFPEGAYAIRRDGEGVYRPSCFIEPKRIVGTNGAGDAFFAGLLYGLHEELPLDRALDLAAASAIFNLRSLTANGGAPTLEEIKTHLRSAAYSPVPDCFRR